jgi:hypothetical protein
MTEQSTAELERDAERVRAQIADTAEHLQDKMSPGQLMDEVVNYFKDGDINQMLGNLKTQVRENPLALAMVGSGLAWLMMGSGPGGTNGLPNRNALSGDRQSGRPMAGSNTYGANTSNSTSFGSGGSASAGTGFRASASALGEKVSETAGELSESAARTMHDLRDGAADSLSHASQAGADAAARAKSTFFDALDREPLVLGALGVAVGAAIGAMLPTTSVEREYLGDASSKAREGAGELVAEGIDKAREVGSDAYRAARNEADRQGLMPQGKQLVDRVSDVASAAGAELKAAAVDAVDSAEAAADAASDKWSARRNRP